MGADETGGEEVVETGAGVEAGAGVGGTARSCARAI
jgi:hypothetical protein